MQIQVKPWENSLGIQVPEEVLEAADIHCEDYLSIEIIDGSIVLKKSPRHHTLEERAAKCGGKAGPYSEYEWTKPIDRRGGPCQI